MQRCPGSCVSTGAKFPVAPVESAPMVYTICNSKTTSLAHIHLTGTFCNNTEIVNVMKQIDSHTKLHCMQFIFFQYCVTLEGGDTAST